MLYKSVANISQNIDNIPSYLKDDIMALLQQVSRYMLRPLSVLNGRQLMYQHVSIIYCSNILSSSDNTQLSRESI